MSRLDALCASPWMAGLGANAVSNARTKPAHRRVRPAQPDADTFTVWGRLRLPPKGLCNPPKGRIAYAPTPEPTLLWGPRWQATGTAVPRRPASLVRIARPTRASVHDAWCHGAVFHN